ncbi:type IX secretion system sortase PorU [Mangrovimonas sp. YM274]|uniref:type IX secretion system sortase PorU n=1 Tax=Mangrovimonas sp. YM274 TaxID=3070660 RepID=UPI0027DDD44C|nr:type IX secretion system sortase PorU [Mangrovimonas sp. YM274]WMI69652.1 type IX secretion system sortase PorU [Mangrovimonas sp. YM274]
MKKSLHIFFALMSFFGFSQQQQFQITWGGTKVLETSVSKMTLPAFNSSNYVFDDERGLIFFSTLENVSRIDESSIALSNVSYSTISKSDLKDLPLNTIPKSPRIKAYNTSARGVLGVQIEVSPIIEDRGVYKKITGFTAMYNLGGAASRNGQGVMDVPTIGNSVLANGEWYKFYVDKTGVFRLTKSFLNDLGVNTNVDPRTIKIYGNGGAMLPMANSVDYPFDVMENAIEFVGEEDGVFNNEDYILMYAEGPTGYNEESETNINAYTDRSYYYVNISSGEGKRIQELSQPDAEPDLVIDTFQDYQFHEVDEYNLAKIGRRWFGDRFGIENEKEFTFSFPNLVPSEQAKVRVYTAAVSETQTSMAINLNGSLLTNFSYAPIEGALYAREANFGGNVTLGSSELVFNLSYNNNGNPASYAYLDFISVEATRELRFEGEQMLFQNNSVANIGGVVEYQLSNSSAVSQIWDVTNKYEVKGVRNEESNSVFSFKSQSGSLRNYVAVTPSDYYQPLRESSTSVSNQNIKGTIFKNSQGEFQDVDYVIVTPNILVSQAERLAQINRDQYGLVVKIVTLNELYTEFSSGNQDISAIRNLMRYVYHNASTPENRVKYLCLFGDSSYDYKDRLPNNTNLVPSWLSKNSFSLTSSYISDDFYGMMDVNEGDMTNSNLLDIAVGRILAEDLQRATEMVDKIDTYHKSSSYGSWRNNFVLIADDVDVAWENQLQDTSNTIGDMATSEHPSINVVKIFCDAYQQQASAGGNTYPQVEEAIIKAIEAGALVVNYFGHGGEDGLSKERIFSKADSQELQNTCKYNCFVTVTCEYTKFDDPQRPTAGEYTYWNKEGGAIALITTTRQIFMSVAVPFNSQLGDYLFEFGDNPHVSIAEALRLTKNSSSVSGNGQKFMVFSIGDPALKLAMPRPDIRLTKINDVPLGGDTDVLQALGKVKLSGEVVDELGSPMPTYNGVLTATVFDKNIERQTLGNDGTTDSNGVIKMDFETLGEILFKGQVTVTNGEFEFEFVVPRDIGIPVGNGKVSFYAKTENPLQDQAGASFDIQVGGINENAEEDNIGPVINLYMNDTNFVSGGITNESPTFLAKLQDDNGINTASGIGHDIVAIIDGDETNPIVLNDYYTANIDDYQNGEVSYPFRNLEPGLHTLTLKAWDVYNNSATSELQFVVHDKDQELVINNVLNYPNPFVDYTEFWFNHNSSGNLDVSIQIFTVSGKLVRTLNGQTNADGECCNQGTSSLSRSITWDGRDDFGEKIGKGVYIYKLKVRSNLLNKQVEKIQKLVIL